MISTDHTIHDQTSTNTDLMQYQVPEVPSIAKTIDEMHAQFSYLKTLSRTQPINDWATRETQLDNLEIMLSDNQASFANAISADFGYLSESETQFG